MRTNMLHMALGEVKGYIVHITSNHIKVYNAAGEIVVHEDVPNYGTDILDIATRQYSAMGWGQFPDGDEVIYVYDKADGNFGYALNIRYAPNNEWGYAPFEVDASVPQKVQQ